MIVVFIIIEIALIVFTVAAKFYADVVPLFGELYVPFIWISVVIGIITAVYIGARIYVEINEKRNKGKDEEKK